MKLIIVRHGDPNYAIDSLTRKGKKEAMLLAKKLAKANIDYFYCSPLGRAKKTASYTMKKYDKKLEILPWLHEFKGKIKEDGKPVSCWDRLPSEWTNDDIHYTDKWYQSELMNEPNVETEYRKVCDGIDALFEKHGYIHEGRVYKAVNSNHDTIVLFCHFAVECVILSHIFGMSPMILWHNFVAAPSSVTTLVTEEREKGIAVFRMMSFGDTGHLYAGGDEPAFAARFCECYEDDTRH
ncbi:MAG: histidine phosphatase family protein [Faecalibacterium sp.]|nr:histidine phosphatase family protein [Ruminococcus sp.]MCM1392852.1 histidine phosphatase family protein [Ruminococcus sp.]MCM1486409.1 histidine phosphatase family protein [Faecalibacterium sp.]